MQKFTSVLVGLMFWACATVAPTAVDQSVQKGDVQSAILAYERHRTVHGPDTKELAKVAGLVLESETLVGGARRNDALQQLALAGIAAKPVLERLVSRQEPRVAPARASALELLSQLGDAEAQNQLRSMKVSKDEEVNAARVGALDPDADVNNLLEALKSPQGLVRQAVVNRLAHSKPQPNIYAAVLDTARRDPLGAVRVDAMAALLPYGLRAEPAIVTGLKDPHLPVRLVAMDIAAKSKEPKLLSLLVPYLENPPDQESIEAARQLALNAEQKLAKKARAFIFAALASEDSMVRHQSIVALQTLKLNDKELAVIWDKVASESEADIKVALCDTLLSTSSYSEKLVPMLEELSQAESLAAVHATLALSKIGKSEFAAKRLMELVDRGPIAARANAARALARDLGKPDEARVALKAAHPRVRIEAAGGILVAAQPEAI
ncbi:MAG: hypothetical protein IPJ88_07330 [Myxococcales bacterium]|nr:MAG: hypothetical protein IPJ88_07330 [Myxococcales bacterium]